MKYYLIIGERSKGRKKAMKEKIRDVYDDFVEVFLKNNDEGLYDVIKAAKSNDYYTYNLIFAWEWYKRMLKKEIDEL